MYFPFLGKYAHTIVVRRRHFVSSLAISGHRLFIYRFFLPKKTISSEIARILVDIDLCFCTFVDKISNDKPYDDECCKW